MIPDRLVLVAVNELHNRAMDNAMFASEIVAGEESVDAKRLLRRAFQMESAAADMFASSFDLEPSRSVLFRSAASLALQCGENKAAEKLIERGLAGKPPVEIARELKLLLTQTER